MFNGASFNNTGFNVSESEYNLSSNDDVNIIVLDNNSELLVNISANDNIVLNIDGEQDKDYLSIDIIDIALEEGHDIYSETSGLDPPTILLGEHANLYYELSASDTITVTTSQKIPLGFNNIGFNQPQGETEISFEKAIVGIPFSDELEITTDENVIEQIVYINASDTFSIIIDGDDKQYYEASVSDALTIDIDEYSVIDKDIPSTDDITVSIQEESKPINILVSDSLKVTIDLDKRITSTFMYLVDGEWLFINKGYIMVNKQWKPIIKYYGMVNQEWKPMKE